MSYVKTLKRKGLLLPEPSEPFTFPLTPAIGWQSLRLDMAASSVRDLIIKGDDLAAATHGRGFWILDDITHCGKSSTERRRQWQHSSGRKPPRGFAGT